MLPLHIIYLLEINAQRVYICCKSLLKMFFSLNIYVNFAVVLVRASEAPQEALPVEEGGLEGESWAKPLAHLWQSRPPNLKKEREYNQQMCSKPPYCSICMLFYTYQQVFALQQTALTTH